MCTKNVLLHILKCVQKCPVSISSELFSYTTICSSFNLIDKLFFSYRVTADRQTDKQTDRHNCSIVGV